MVPTRHLKAFLIILMLRVYRTLISNRQFSTFQYYFLKIWYRYPSMPTTTCRVTQIRRKSLDLDPANVYGSTDPAPGGQDTVQNSLLLILDNYSSLGSTYNILIILLQVILIFLKRFVCRYQYINYCVT